MGLGTNDNSSSGATFLSVRISTDAKGRKHAILAKRCDQGTPGAKQVFKADGNPAVTKDGDNVYRLEYDWVEGSIVKLEKHEADYGGGKTQSYLHVHIRDGADLYVLSLDRGDRYWSDFLLRLPMVDPTKPVVFQPYSIADEEGKTNQGISMKQGGQKVERRWNKERGYDGGPPAATFDEDEQEWKYGKRNRWMEEHILDPIAQEIAALDAPAEPAKAAPSAASVEDDDDGLPF